MSDTRIDFSAPATLRKWPSVNKERVSAALGARPYMIMDGTLDECIERFMSQPESQHHLYEIHTAPQSDLVSAILSADHVIELARLRDFLGNRKRLTDATTGTLLRRCQRPQRRCKADKRAYRVSRTSLRSARRIATKARSRSSG